MAPVPVPGSTGSCSSRFGCTPWRGGDGSDASWMIGSGRKWQQSSRQSGELGIGHPKKVQRQVVDVESLVVEFHAPLIGPLHAARCHLPGTGTGTGTGALTGKNSET